MFRNLYEFETAHPFLAAVGEATVIVSIVHTLILLLTL